MSGYATNIIQILINGKSATFQLNDSMNYDILSENSFDDFWSLLLHKGYLTVDWNATDALDDSSIRYNNICAKPPNPEIRDYLIKLFQSKFGSEFIKHNLHNKLVDALSCGNKKKLMTSSLTCYKNMSQYEIQQPKLLYRTTIMAF